MYVLPPANSADEGSVFMNDEGGEFVALSGTPFLVTNTVESLELAGKSNSDVTPSAITTLSLILPRSRF